MRRLVIFVIVLALIAVAVDRVVWFVARNQIAAAVQESQRLDAEPEVSIGGFPLLTQAYDGVYDDVTVRTKGLAVEDGAKLDSADIMLKGVHIPLRDLVGQDVAKVPVDHADVRAKIGFPSLNQVVAARINNDQIAVTFGAGSAPDQVKITGKFASTVFDGELGGEAKAVINSGNLVVTVLPDTLTTIPSPFRSTVAGLLSQTLEIPPLPFGFVPQALTVGSDGVTVTAAGDDLVLQEVDTTKVPGNMIGGS